MNILQSIKDFLQNLSKKNLIQVSLGIASFIILLIIGTILWQNYTTSLLQKNLVKINKLRVESVELINKFQEVRDQQDYVSDLLTKDKDFRIKEFFDTMVKELFLERNVGNTAEVSESQDLGNGYDEIQLGAQFTSITTKQVCEILEKIEKNKLVYVKELTLTKIQQTALLDVSIKIATLQLKTAQT